MTKSRWNGGSFPIAGWTSDSVSPLFKTVARIAEQMKPVTRAMQQYAGLAEAFKQHETTMQRLAEKLKPVTTALQVPTGLAEVLRQHENAMRGLGGAAETVKSVTAALQPSSRLMDVVRHHQDTSRWLGEIAERLRPSLEAQRAVADFATRLTPIRELALRGFADAFTLFRSFDSDQYLRSLLERVGDETISEAADYLDLRSPEQLSALFDVIVAGTWRNAKDLNRYIRRAVHVLIRAGRRPLLGAHAASSPRVVHLKPSDWVADSGAEYLTQVKHSIARLMDVAGDKAELVALKLVEQMSWGEIATLKSWSPRQMENEKKRMTRFWKKVGFNGEPDVADLESWGG